MREFMEEKGQFYHQGVREAKEFTEVHAIMQTMVGPFNLLTLSDDAVARFMASVSDIAHTYDGNTVTVLIGNN